MLSLISALPVSLIVNSFIANLNVSKIVLEAEKCEPPCVLDVGRSVFLRRDALVALVRLSNNNNNNS